MTADRTGLQSLWAIDIPIKPGSRRMQKISVMRKILSHGRLLLQS